MVEAITGNSWEELVTEEVLEPLKMTRSVSGHDKLVAAAYLAPYWGGRAPDGAMKGQSGLLPGITNVAAPHGPDTQGGQAVYPWHHQQVTAAATNVVSTAHDMAVYMMVHLQTSEFLKPTTMNEMFLAQNLHAPREGMRAVGLGWMIYDYKSNRVLRHSGGQVGYTSLTSLVPSENAGVTVLLNDDYFSGKTYIVESLISSILLDKVLRLPCDPAAQQDPLENFMERKRAIEKKLAIHKKEAAERRVGLSLPLDHYAGHFVHPANGSLEITVTENRLTFQFAPLISGELIHETGETFGLRFDREHFHDHSMILTFSTGLEPQPNSFILTAPPTREYQSSPTWTYQRR